MQDRFYDEFGTVEFEELKLSPQELQTINRVLILSCGTAWHAGCIAALMLEDIARIPTEAKIASEFRYTNPIISEDTLVITISHRGKQPTQSPLCVRRKQKEQKGRCCL